MTHVNFASLENALIPGVTLVRGAGDLYMLDIDNPFCQATVSLMGGQVLSYQRKASTEPLLFCSSQAYFVEGKGIKGGAPVCWPWFGDDPRWQGAHGFARSSYWQVDEIHSDDCGVTEIVLSLPESVFAANPQWQYGAKLRTTIRCGKWLSIALETENIGAQAMPLTQALHTYFNVGDCQQVKVEGLEESHYLDKVLGMSRCQATGEAITFHAEVDRIYDQARSDIVLIDAALNRRIHIQSEGSASAIVWNPWEEKSRAMSDFGDDEFYQMVCIETANAGDDKRYLAPGETHTLRVHYRELPIAE